MTPDPVEVRQTRDFARWLAGLRDVRARARIVARLRRLSLGQFGDAKPLGGSLAELRVDTGPGYRLYFVRRRMTVIVLLVGGDKDSQAADIARARDLAARWEPD